MSQVVVTKDVLSERRVKSGLQEKQIETEYMSENRMSNPTKKDPVAMVLGIVALPVLGAWSVLTGIVYLVMSLFRVIMTGIGKIVK
jgi:hypothetical protein